MKGSIDVVRAQGPYDLPPELHYLTPPPAWRAVAARSPGVPPADSGRPKLLARIRAAIQMRQYSPRTEEAYVQWIRRDIFFHKLRHPAEMGTEEIQAFLSHLAVRGNVSASTQNQALCALIFLYKVLGKEIGVLGDVVRAQRPRRLPGC